ncbi:hypothetical protein [Rubinisphaera margarita]|uniref:hypothetical protein n=1 Tax=Rubinisphaera margarita TaxID=2909586 RepID=UPI001EE941F7|nr:hypothetical protein [Rubinisphaera margarita]MCG6156369.1 hypothetical protein [Rubinisphaera margarita]
MKLITYTTSLTLLLGTICFVGCEKPATNPTTSSSEEDHGHPHEEAEGGHSHGEGPHGGTVADWGGGTYHVEFTVDHDEKSATVYVLGEDQKTPVPVAAESVLLNIKDPAFQVTLEPAPLNGETDGKASRFTGKHESLGIVREFAGTISAEVEGTPYAGNFAEEAHGHGHGHSHGVDDALVWEGEPETHAGMTILLGHHGQHLHAGEEVEPAVAITRDGQPVADAKVFNALINGEDKSVIAAEVPTVYEPETPEEPAHYAQGGLMIPAGAKNVMIRFRIVPAGAEPVTYDVPIAVE